MSPWLRVGLAGILIAINGLLVTAEFALVRARVLRLEAMRRRGSRRAGLALDLMNDLPRTLATTQVGITLASLGIGWLGEAAVAELLMPLLGPLRGFGLLGSETFGHALAIAVGFLLITFATVILGELVPKAIGIQRAEATFLIAAPPLRVLSGFLFPVVWLTNKAAAVVLRFLRLPVAFGEETAHTEEDLRAILGRFRDQGSMSRVGRDLLERVLVFSSLTARQIMIPRPDVIWLSTIRTPQENLELATSSGYTRFPYCDGDLDHVIGVVHIKDLAGLTAAANLASVLRPPVVVPETATADLLLRQFQKRKLHLGIVVDEYGGTSGIVTLEDVLEEIVGEVQDEFDQELPEISPAGEGRVRISGTARLEEAARSIGVEAPEHGAEIDTVAGWVQHALGRVAKPGDAVDLGGYTLRVEETSRNRITKILAIRKADVSS